MSFYGCNSGRRASGVGGDKEEEGEYALWSDISYGPKLRQGRHWGEEDYPKEGIKEGHLTVGREFSLGTIY